MKQTIFWFSIMLATFTLGVTAAVVWIYSYSPIDEKSVAISLPREEKHSFEEMPILAYCEVANNSEQYNGKIVRISGTLIRSHHGTQFSSPNCYTEQKRTAVVFNSQDWEILSRAEPDRYSSYEDKPAASRRFEVIAVGTFSRTKPFPGASNVLENSYLRFEILRIERAAKQ